MGTATDRRPAGGLSVRPIGVSTVNALDAMLRELDARVIDECPNLRDFPLGGAGYTEAMDRYYELRSAIQAAREQAALQRRKADA
jgi:hypothetical protein